jgi:hypothetical protein
MTPDDVSREWIEMAYRSYREDGDRLAVWDAIGAALDARLPLPLWVTDYLNDVSLCFHTLRRIRRPAPDQIDAAIAGAILEPRAELTRLCFDYDRGQLHKRRRALSRSSQSEAPSKQAEVSAWEHKIASARQTVRARQTGRRANPFTAGDLKQHAIMLAMDTWGVLTTDWSRDHATGHTPTMDTYRRAAVRHRATCHICKKTPSWKTVQRAWLTHKQDVIPPTARAKQ